MVMMMRCTLGDLFLWTLTGCECPFQLFEFAQGQRRVVLLLVHVERLCQIVTGVVEGRERFGGEECRDFVGASRRGPSIVGIHLH